ETINRFNAETPVARAYLNPNGQVELMHYMIADYGITSGSLMVNIGAFMSAIDKWSGEYSSGNLSNTVSFRPLIADESTDQHLSQDAMTAMWSDATLINGAAGNDMEGDR
ncbi:MAG: YbjN domain-containing protein, partial [Pseudomonadota bacterium]